MTASRIIRIGIIPEKGHWHSSDINKIDHSRLFALARVIPMLVFIHFYTDEVCSAIDKEIGSLFAANRCFDGTIMDKGDIVRGEDIPNTILLCMGSAFDFIGTTGVTSPLC